MTRFPLSFETAHIHRMMREELQKDTGTVVLWYAYDPSGTTSHEIYDVGESRIWVEPTLLPVIAAIREEGPLQQGAPAFYSTDHVHLVVSYDEWTKHGLGDPQRIDDHLKARFVYDDVVFHVVAMQVRGQVRERDIVIGLDAAEVDPSDLVNDEQFQEWAST